MCGLAGFISWKSLSSDANHHLEAMTDALSHRGPDDSGQWIDEEVGVALGHRRLSIVDLSPAGHQPMLSPSGRFAMVFNGEIYNHNELRAEIQVIDPSKEWRGHSDTETLLAGFEQFGILATIQKSSGMFAIAVWDRKERQLTLVRDRLGEKPLYYGWQQGFFLFGSELKALRAHPSFERTINRDALCLFLKHNCIGGSYSIYQGIQKLEPGHVLVLSYGDISPSITPYWSLEHVALNGFLHPFNGTPDEAVDKLECLLSNAVNSQMMSDVPLGAFLSGGIDSSTIVALMQKQSSQATKTFSIGFTEDQYDEAKYAKEVASHLKTDHTELYVSPEQARSVIPLLPNLYDEPFADSSQIPTFLVAQLAKKKVTVALSGDAGDELFCGYNRYRVAASEWRMLSKIPAPIRKAIAKGILSLSPQQWNNIGNHIPQLHKHTNIGDKIHKAAGVMASSSVDELYDGLVSHWKFPSEIVVGGYVPPDRVTSHNSNLEKMSDPLRMVALDLLSYLPDDILTKVDRAAMGVSLESRVPFLDTKVVEFALSLPLSIRLRGGKTKWPLRQILYKHVPQRLVERPKMGFGVPLDSWLRGPLKGWAEDLLSTDRLNREGFLNSKLVRDKWNEHLSGTRNWSYHLWDVLMFEAWLSENRP